MAAEVAGWRTWTWGKASCDVDLTSRYGTWPVLGLLAASLLKSDKPCDATIWHGSLHVTVTGSGSPRGPCEVHMLVCKMSGTGIQRVINPMNIQLGGNWPSATEQIWK